MEMCSFLYVTLWLFYAEQFRSVILIAVPATRHNTEVLS